MSAVASFTKHENELAASFRNRIKGAEGAADVQQIYAEFVKDMLSRISGAEVVLDEGDVRVDPGVEDGFVLGPGIARNPDYERFLKMSDLLDILRRQGQHAANKITHLDRRPERDQAKIFPRPNRRG
ncbi:MAG: hypothetical protein KKA55_05620 [Proteobacteria bacterium]|nr:hypothetical protein [Pseudomonadota bacterium]MBU1595000.1 hypothetical protein [Pseudomonadota bacterium]